MKDRLSYLRLLYRLPLLLLYILVATPIVVVSQSRAGRSIRIGKRLLSEIVACWWCGLICRIVGVRRRVNGQFLPGPQLVAANHISWLDIQLLYSEEPVGFVSKAEIANWPVVGWLGKLGGVVFHQRGSHDSASAVSSAINERLLAGGNVAIFPEGGILRGHGVKMFHARMFAAAIETNSPVQPVMLRYSRNGQYYDDITFLPHEKTLDNFFRLLRQKPCTAEIHILPRIQPQGLQRRQLAGQAEAAVRAAFESELPGG